MKGESERTEKLSDAANKDDSGSFVRGIQEFTATWKADAHPIQMEILRNLVGKLKSGRNHKLCDLLSKIVIG